MKYFKVIYIVFVLFNILLIQNAYSYIDPGTGSYILQILLASILAGVFMIKLFFRQIKDFFKKTFSRGKDNEQSET